MKLSIVIAVTLVHIAIVYFLARSPSSEKTGRPVLDTRSPTEAEGSVSSLPSETTPKQTAVTPTDLRDISPSLHPNPAVSRKATSCKAGILVDWTNRRILWRRKDTAVAPIASLTKMMTAYLLVEAIATRPDISLETLVKVTATAAEIAGSQVYLDPRETFSLKDLLKCTMIFSANDAAHLIAEFLGGGDVQKFVKEMNAQANRMGLSHTRFLNPHGLPTSNGSENESSPLEMACLAGHLLDCPEIVRWSSTWLSYLRENTPKPFQLVNRNALVNPHEGVPGVNGMKTGYTRDAGFCIAATCVREGRTLVAVVTGCPSSKERNSLVGSLLEWGYGAQPQ